MEPETSMQKMSRAPEGSTKGPSGFSRKSPSRMPAGPGGPGAPGAPGGPGSWQKEQLLTCGSGATKQSHVV